MANPQEFYREHSPFSDPGQYRPWYDTLPDDIKGLCQVVRGIYLHYMGGSLVNYQPSPARLGEVDLRYIEAILSRVLELDEKPLTTPRSPEKRFVGCCRDSALLLCSMLRHKGIPARIRVGFATYFRMFGPTFKTGHVVTEYWDAKAERWILVDPEMSASHIRVNRIDFDVHDIPPGRFLTGGKAWQLCRDGSADAQEFGAAPDDFFKGWWALRNRVIHELAMLNKDELLLWDSWSWMDYNFEPTETQLEALDQIARLTQQGDAHFAILRALYEQDSRFKRPATIMCYSPTDNFHSVTLNA